MNLRASNEGGSWEEFSWAMIEVQAYFKWLRWNLARALQDDPLPDPVIQPNVRRPPIGTRVADPLRYTGLHLRPVS